MAESVTRKVIPDEVATTLGVPLTTPVALFRLRPVGRVPATIEKLKGPVPPVRAGAKLKAAFCVAGPGAPLKASVVDTGRQAADM